MGVESDLIWTISSEARLACAWIQCYHLRSDAAFPPPSPGVIAVAVFVLLCVAAIAIRLYQQKNLYSTKEAKPPENPGHAPTGLRCELSLQSAVCGNQKEYFF